MGPVLLDFVPQSQLTDCTPVPPVGLDEIKAASSESVRLRRDEILTATGAFAALLSSRFFHPKKRIRSRDPPSANPMTAISRPKAFQLNFTKLYNKKRLELGGEGDSPADDRPGRRDADELRRGGRWLGRLSRNQEKRRIR